MEYASVVNNAIDTHLCWWLVFVLNGAEEETSQGKGMFHRYCFTQYTWFALLLMSAVVLTSLFRGKARVQQKRQATKLATIFERVTKGYGIWH